ncbi:MAG: alpha/beta fold hydrolase [Porphyrobacter sp.]|nr:alpha/beta fold hydrolase [Porphyrobacter sp.]
MATNAAPLRRSIPEAAVIREALTRRVALAREKAPENVHGPSLQYFLGEALTPLEPLLRQFREPLELPQSAKPRVVMLLPGFGTHPFRMRYMAEQLERAGHKVKRWGLGFNFGPTEENFALLEKRLEQIHQRYGQEVVLVGWSLGGVFAREMAKRNPDLVAKVITMGSPFSGTPYANNAWRIYNLVTGHSVAQPPIAANMAAKPPVETVALWSPRDGIVSPRSSCGRAGERDRAIALRCTHLGFANSAEAIEAVARELELP